MRRIQLLRSEKHASHAQHHYLGSGTLFRKSRPSVHTGLPSDCISKKRRVRSRSSSCQKQRISAYITHFHTKASEAFIVVLIACGTMNSQDTAWVFRCWCRGHASLAESTADASGASSPWNGRSLVLRLSRPKFMTSLRLQEASRARQKRTPRYSS